jgi:hypothetical protein
VTLDGILDPGREDAGEAVRIATVEFRFSPPERWGVPGSSSAAAFKRYTSKRTPCASGSAPLAFTVLVARRI